MTWPVELGRCNTGLCFNCPFQPIKSTNSDYRGCPAADPAEEAPEAAAPGTLGPGMVTTGTGQCCVELQTINRR